MAATITADPGTASRTAKDRVLAYVTERRPRPTELLDLLHGELSYSDIQDVVSELLDTGELELTSDRHLHITHQR